MNHIYITPHKGVWSISKEKTEEVISLHDTKEEAVAAAKNIFNGKDNIKIVVLSADGSVDNFEDDPFDSYD